MSVPGLSAKSLAAMIAAGVVSALAGVWMWQFFAPLLQPEPDPEVITAQQAVIAKALSVGSQRPLFTLPDADGVEHSVSEWDGKLLLVNFWATWCPPCLAEIPDFIKLQAQFAYHGVQFLGVAVDSAENVRRFAIEQGMNYPSLHGQAEAIEVGRLYGNRYGALPFTVVISPDGKVIHTQAGVLEFAEAKKLIQEFIDNSG